jgi:hypothetical protein
MCVTGCGNVVIWGEDGNEADGTKVCDSCERKFCGDCVDEYMGTVPDQEGSVCRYCIHGPKQLFEMKDMVMHLAGKSPMTQEEVVSLLKEQLEGDVCQALQYLLKLRHMTSDEVTVSMHKKGDVDEEFVSIEDAIADEEEERDRRPNPHGEPKIKRAAK